MLRWIRQAKNKLCWWLSHARKKTTEKISCFGEQGRRAQKAVFWWTGQASAKKILSARTRAKSFYKLLFSLARPRATSQVLWWEMSHAEQINSMFAFCGVLEMLEAFDVFHKSPHNLFCFQAERISPQNLHTHAQKTPQKCGVRNVPTREGKLGKPLSGFTCPREALWRAWQASPNS